MIKFLSTKVMAQRSITSFFKPSDSNKRKLSQSVTTDEVNQQPKQQKTSTEQTSNCDLSESIKRQVRLTPALSENIGQTWFKALKPEFSKDYFKQLSKFLSNERQSYTVYPPINHVYSWTINCDIREVKVVILGQDPYHGPKQAHGLAFSVVKGVPPPPSLLNIFQELESDIPDFEKPSHGDLTGWAQQGVLLLNACLTVRAHNANSHSNKGWEHFTDAVIKWLNTNLSGVVFLLWGTYANKKGSFVDKKKHLVLQTVHPSPLSAYRGFLGSKHFSLANNYLIKNGKNPIDWKKLP